MSNALLLSREFASALDSVAVGKESADGLIGLEHEYRIIENGRALDFSALIHDLPVLGRRLDPGDLNAYRCPSGLVVTCDESEAEVASPPIPLQPGFASLVDGWARTGLAVLDGVLPREVEASGYSTHLSVSVPNELADDVCDHYLRTFAPALMLLLDGPSSFGIYLRSRPGRLEACGEYSGGRHLRAVSAFFAGSTRAVVAGLGADRRALLPPELHVNAHPAWGRHGFYLGRRHVFDFDLYANPRRGLLRRLGGGTIRAQDDLGLAFDAASSSLNDTANDEDLDDLHAVAEGSLPLRVEAELSGDVGSVSPIPQTIFGEILDCCTRPGFSVEAVAATWGFTVFRLAGDGRDAFACVPSKSLEIFLRRLPTGQLDELLHAYLALSSAGRRLASEEQTGAPGLWDSVSSSTELLPKEHPPNPIGSASAAAVLKAGRGAMSLATRRPGKLAAAYASRPGKVAVGSTSLFEAGQHPPPDLPPASPPTLPSRGPWRPVAVVVLATVLVIAVVAIAWALVGGGGKPGYAPSRTPIVVPGVLVTEPPALPSGDLPATDRPSGALSETGRPPVVLPETASPHNDTGAVTTPAPTEVPSAAPIDTPRTLPSSTPPPHPTPPAI